MPSHEDWMRTAIALAKRGQGNVEPNPMVGCVIILDDEIIGQGFHERFGGHHAEVNAIESVPKRLKDQLGRATVYVTLEPCSHFGKTPPCADMLIESGVGHVQIAVEDPNPQVAGQGIGRLRDANVRVEVGTCREQAIEVLAPYLKRTRTGLPWVIAKWAMTIDGKIATRTKHSQWISGEKSRKRVHRLRARVDAICVGIGTVLADDPMLNARLDENEAPRRVATRVVFDSQARTPLDSKLVASAKKYPTLIAVGSAADKNRCEEFRRLGCDVLCGDSRDQLLEHTLRQLAKQGATTVLVEGGPVILGAMHDRQLIDELHVYIGNKLIGDAEAFSPISGQPCPILADSISFKLSHLEKLDEDALLVYRKFP